ncbi:hypothetical protein HY312_04710 [Candidatus Saccharibacteria bacterium]|nr:hypothetical protein [Candidatus Saccharibacteria bacterium]
MSISAVSADEMTIADASEIIARWHERGQKTKASNFDHLAQKIMGDFVDPDQHTPHVHGKIRNAICTANANGKIRHEKANGGGYAPVTPEADNT